MGRAPSYDCLRLPLEVASALGVLISKVLEVNLVNRASRARALFVVVGVGDNDARSSDLYFFFPGLFRLLGREKAGAV